MNFTVYYRVLTGFFPIFWGVFTSTFTVSDVESMANRSEWRSGTWRLLVD